MFYLACCRHQPKPLPTLRLVHKYHISLLPHDGGGNFDLEETLTHGILTVV